MGHTKISAITVVFGVFIWLVPSVEAQVNCDVDPPGSLQAAIDAAATGATITVSGTCNENVVIQEEKIRLTVDGGGTAVINGPNPTQNTIIVRGNKITIRNFASITGGRHGIAVQSSGLATIDGNGISGTGRRGINVNEGSSVTIINNAIEDNPNDGIFVTENSSARIGFISATDTVASPNTIQRNSGGGIIVSRSANVQIVGNTISNNTDDGILVSRVSHAEIASNTIDGNGRDGVLVGENSGVNLGRDTGTGIFNLPNNTTVGSENTGFGIRCFINSYANGRLGTLNGNSGATSFTGGCINSLIP